MSQIILKLLVILFCFPAFAQSSEGLSKLNNLLIGADKALRKKDIVELDGNVQLIFQEQHLSADRATVNFATKEFVASGQIVLKNATATIEAESMTWNYETNTGILYHAVVSSGQVYFEGDVVEKTGEQEYIANRASYTACNTCPPGWGFSGRKIEAQIGGYAYMHNTTLRFANLPVFWSPYLIVPLKSTRQTGLLPPSFDYQGTGGFAYNQRLFWAISKSQDATFGAKLYQKRGFKGLFNYRYVFTKDSRGDIDLGYLKDRVFADDDGFKRPGASDPGWAVDRWFMRYEHKYFLPDNFVHKMNLNIVRDLRYPRDFTEDVKNQGDPALDNRMSLTRNSETHHASLDTSYYLNLLEDNPLADNRLAVHRIPELRYSAMERPLFSTPLVYNFDAKYSNFVRDGLTHDDVIHRGTSNCREDRCQDTADNTSFDPAFNPDRDLIRTGQRLILQPSLALPFQAGPYVDITPRSTLTHNQYAFNVDPAPQRAGLTADEYDFNPHPSFTYLRHTVTARTRFSHVFGDLADSQATRWKHSFEPEIGYTTVPYLKKTNHSFFGPLSEIPSYRRDEPITDLDFDNFDNTATNSSTGLQFDYNDRINDRNVAGVILHNYLTRKIVRGTTTEYMRVATLNVGQTYDYDEDRKGADKRRPWGALKTLLDVRLEHFNTNTVINYYPYHSVADVASRVMLNDKTKFIQATYTQKFVITEQVPADASLRTETLGLNAGYDYKYARFKAGITYSLTTHDMQEWAYGLDLKPPGNCLIVHLGLSQTITNPDPFYHVAFDFKFDGQG